MTLHGALSIITTVSPGREAALTALLQQIDADPGSNPLIPFSNIGSIHFARFVICPARPDAKGNPVPCRLVFTTNYDRSSQDHLTELIQHAGHGLWIIFSYCEGFPADTAAGNTPPFDPNTLKNYLNQRSVKPNTFYVGVGHRSVAQIRQENQLRKDIQHYLDLNS